VQTKIREEDKTMKRTEYTVWKIEYTNKTQATEQQEGLDNEQLSREYY
jgi:hypothetical protein